MVFPECIYPDQAFTGAEPLERFDSSGAQECRGKCVQKSGACQHWTYEPNPADPDLGGFCSLYSGEAALGDQPAVGCLSGDVFCQAEGNATYAPTCLLLTLREQSAWSAMWTLPAAISIPLQSGSLSALRTAGPCAREIRSASCGPSTSRPTSATLRSVANL